MFAYTFLCLHWELLFISCVYFVIQVSGVGKAALAYMKTCFVCYSASFYYISIKDEKKELKKQQLSVLSGQLTSKCLCPSSVRSHNSSFAGWDSVVFFLCYTMVTVSDCRVINTRHVLTKRLPNQSSLSVLHDTRDHEGGARNNNVNNHWQCVWNWLKKDLPSVSQLPLRAVISYCWSVLGNLTLVSVSPPSHWH